MAMAQQLVQQQQQQGTVPASQATAGTSTGSGQAGFELFSPGEVAQQLNVSEGDVIATIESGELKAKKIGSTYRITRTALEDFLKS
jgi:excisionase family DNA binding protein